MPGKLINIFKCVRISTQIEIFLILIHTILFTFFFHFSKKKQEIYEMSLNLKEEILKLSSTAPVYKEQDDDFYDG